MTAALTFAKAVFLFNIAMVGMAAFLGDAGAAVWSFASAAGAWFFVRTFEG